MPYLNTVVKDNTTAMILWLRGRCCCFNYRSRPYIGVVFSSTCTLPAPEPSHQKVGWHVTFSSLVIQMRKNQSHLLSKKKEHALRDGPSVASIFPDTLSIPEAEIKSSSKRGLELKIPCQNVNEPVHSVLCILHRDLAILVQVKLFLEPRLDQYPVDLNVTRIRQHLERGKSKTGDQQKHLAQFFEEES